MIRRISESSILKLSRDYPILALTGPRQSGKTTLAKTLFKDKPYVSLESLDERGFALEDPRGFLSRFPNGAVLDEAQKAPELFSYLQTAVDADGRMGLYILTGSSQFGLLSGITQSLSGRCAVLSLLPFTFKELSDSGKAPDSLEKMLFTGSYPPIYDRALDPGIWHSNYVSSYLERDVRQLVNVKDLRSFSLFLRLCAARTAQILNLSSLASDCGITHNTAKAWISVLEASYVVHLLRPHYRNFGKRLTKSPKLYFLDSGLAAHLAGIQTPEQLAVHSARGAIFETWAVAEILKARFNSGRTSNLHFWRSLSGDEIDLLIEKGEELLPIEFKSGRTLSADAFAPLERWKKISGKIGDDSFLVHGGDERRSNAIPWRSIGEISP